MSPRSNSDRPSAPSIADEYVTFVQHRIPGLESGTYQIAVSQTVTDAGGKVIACDGLARAYRFAVRGDRFSIGDPAATVAGVFPSNNATGKFDTVFAHAVFSRPAFPWARHPTTEPLAPPAPGQDADADVPTWLAILVLDDVDVVAHSGLSLDPVSGQIRDLFPQAALGTAGGLSTLGVGYSYFDGAADTAGLETGESLSDPIQYLDMPMSLFVGIAPTMDDLKLTAHVREVSVENKALLDGAAEPDDPTGTYAIVVGTRLPQESRKARAYLVSLERLARFLPGDEQGTTPAGRDVDVGRSIRLAVLRSWTFFSTGASATFTDRLAGLNATTDGSARVTGLVLTRPQASPAVQNALAMGYVPMNHALRDGGKTVSWYRGPLAPTATVWGDIALPVSSPDQVTVFDPTTGLLDVSLSAAWTLGRLVALQDKTFSTALYTWKKGLTRKVIDDAEKKIIREMFGGSTAAPWPRATLGEGLAAGPALLQHAMDLVAALGPDAENATLPPADPSRPGHAPRDEDR